MKNQDGISCLPGEHLVRKQLIDGISSGKDGKPYPLERAIKSQMINGQTYNDWDVATLKAQIRLLGKVHHDQMKPCTETASFARKGSWGAPDDRWGGGGKENYVKDAYDRAQNHRDTGGGKGKGKGKGKAKGKAKGKSKGKGCGKSGRELQGTACGYKHGVKSAELWPRFLQHRRDNHGESEEQASNSWDRQMALAVTEYPQNADLFMADRITYRDEWGGEQDLVACAVCQHIGGHQTHQCAVCDPEHVPAAQRRRQGKGK